MWYYTSRKDDEQVITKLSELAEELPTRGFDSYFGRIRLQGYPWNRKRVLRIYRAMKLGLRRRYKKRLSVPVQDPIEVPANPNHTWSADFMSDALTDGRKIRVFNVTDDYNRESLAIEVGLSFSSHRVIRVFEMLEEEYGLPRNLRVDNGPEFISAKFKAWCERKGVTIRFIQPGKPVQNAYIERFNRIFREDILDAYWFEDLDHLRALIHKWREDYNYRHPHKSLKGIPPVLYYQKAVNSGKVRPRNPAHNFPTINSSTTMELNENCLI
jgi:putative transposase